ncbi:hypothetical protein M3Y97_01093100 [Aphelenchoides bicaudatus]|nr:hypothetical protein M3Y97_01093100 [Aphelenchoides bicaudatus]
MQVSQPQQQQPTQQVAFETKGAPHKMPFNPAAKPFKFSGGKAPFGKPHHVVPFSKPSVTPFPKPSFAGKPQQAPAQFPPTPSTIIKPPRFYSNQIFIVPRSKPGTETITGDQAAIDGDCICERGDAIIICQKCGSELIGRAQQKCASHPRKIPLMDHRECLNAECRSIKLVEVSMDEDNF